MTYQKRSFSYKSIKNDDDDDDDKPLLMENWSYYLNKMAPTNLKRPTRIPLKNDPKFQRPPMELLSLNGLLPIIEVEEEKPKNITIKSSIKQISLNDSILTIGGGGGGGGDGDEDVGTTTGGGSSSIVRKDNFTFINHGITIVTSIVFSPISYKFAIAGSGQIQVWNYGGGEGNHCYCIAKKLNIDIETMSWIRKDLLILILKGGLLAMYNDALEALKIPNGINNLLQYTSIASSYNGDYLSLSTNNGIVILYRIRNEFLKIATHCIFEGNPITKMSFLFKKDAGNQDDADADADDGNNIEMPPPMIIGGYHSPPILLDWMSPLAGCKDYHPITPQTWVPFCSSTFEGGYLVADIELQQIRIFDYKNNNISLPLSQRRTPLSLGTKAISADLFSTSPLHNIISFSLSGYLHLIWPNSSIEENDRNVGIERVHLSISNNVNGSSSMVNISDSIHLPKAEISAVSGDVVVNLMKWSPIIPGCLLFTLSSSSADGLLIMMNVDSLALYDV